MLVGSTHSVNLTDGLDGLAISVFGIAAAAFTALAYVSTHREFANYLQLVRLDSAAAELTIFCGALVGASLGFLWWNSYPAEIFMGDVGSLALGGALGTVALLIKQEFLLIIVGGVFVLEALSVIIQVGSFKSTGKRVFKMAPLHHHFELSGWSEPKVIARFLIVAIVFALVQPDDVEAAMKRDQRVLGSWQARGRDRRGAERRRRRAAAGPARRDRHAVGRARRGRTGGRARSRGRDAGARRAHRRRRSAAPT